MKSERRILLAALLAALPVALFAQTAPATPPPTPVDRAERANIAAALYMHRLLSMSDEQLARSRHVIEKVEKLSPAERAELRRHFEGLRDATPAEREKFASEMRERFGIASDAFHPKSLEKSGKSGKTGDDAHGEHSGERRGVMRNLLEKHFASLPPEQAKAEREKFLAMPREEKIAYVRALREKHGLPAEPAHERKEGERPHHPKPPRPKADSPAPKAGDGGPSAGGAPGGAA